MPQVDPRIIERIKKCLRLAKSSEPHEAAAALRQAQKLMSAHGVDETTVELGTIVEENVRSRASSTRPARWELRLFCLVRDAFRLELLFCPAPGTYGAYQFIGPAGDVQMAVYAAKVLQRLLTRARAEFVKSSSSHGKRLTADADLFCLSWLQAVAGQLDNLAARPAAHQQAIARRAEQLATGVANVRGRANQGSLEAAQAGYEAGGQVTLRRPVDGQGRPLDALGAPFAALEHVS